MTQTHPKILCAHFLFYIIKNVTEIRDVYGIPTGGWDMLPKINERASLFIRQVRVELVLVLILFM